jgi:hypothetical protein
MKRVQPAAEIFRTKPSIVGHSSSSSIAMRDLTVTGMRTASRIAPTSRATSSGSAIKHAPKRPDCTRSLGQPQLRLISS